MEARNGFNFAVDVLERLARERAQDEALRAIDSAGALRSFTFAEVADRAARVSGGLAALGVGRGDVVMTLMGARPEWVFAMLGAWRLGAVTLPCSEQLRAKDIKLRVEAARPRAALVAGRDLEPLSAALAAVAEPPAVRNVDAGELPDDEPAEAADTGLEDPALMIFTSGTAAEPKGVLHVHRYLRGQAVQAEHWFGPRPGELAWCTAASGWSKSARNAFVAPWTTGAACLLHEGRFDPGERMAIIAEQQVNVLCQSPTEYRMIAAGTSSLDQSRLPALRRLVSAGEPLNPEVIEVFEEALGLAIHDGYGQTETGQLTGMPAGEPVRPGSMGKPLPGFELFVVDEEGNPTDDGELALDPSTVPTFFHGYVGYDRFADPVWRTGDRVRRDEDGYLWFEGRLDDVILSAGYRIGPFEVESALVDHPAVAEAAAVSYPDYKRGAVVRAVVVLRDGYEPSVKLAAQLQEHVKELTAPYKYPRIVEFREELPKTSSGKIKRAEIRAAWS